MHNGDKIYSIMSISAITNHYLPDKNNGYYCMGNKAACQHFAEDGAKIIPWSKAPEFDDDVVSLRLELTDKNVKSLKGRPPQWLAGLAKLTFLQMPLELMVKMEPGDLPVGLKSLMLVHYETSSYSAPIAWRALAESTALEALTLQNDFGSQSCAAFTCVSDFQMLNLSFLSYDSAKNGKLVTLIDNNKSFELISIDCITHDEINSDAVRNATGLSFIGVDKTIDLHSLEGLSNLEAIFINSAKCEIDCSIFDKMPSIKEVEIINSKKITNPAALLANRKVNKLFVLDCGNPFKKLKKEVDPGDYELLDIDYS
ncbi:hypothetical protein [Cronobacter dublinensis]|uniref:hypothetical protein n=1 Tax=Cronobacter dublinensis TaxID=413497 RepID=UPI001F2F4AF5|nr:hypothetical protein [Cronobacter dublinensis]